MKLTRIASTPETLTVRVEGVNAAYMNTLRRMMMTEVPTLAIERVEVAKNNSIMYDEMLAHRLALVPLTTDLKGYNTKEKHGEQGNPSNEVQLVLKVTKMKGSHTVTAGELVSSDPKVKPVHPAMPLTRLLEGQEIELVAYAELGEGREHTKWTPCLATYRHYPHITVAKQPRNPKRVADRYPGVFDVQGDKLVVAKDGGSNLRDVDLDLEDGEATVTHTDDFILVIESWGQLPPAQILEEAVARYTERLQTFSKTL